MSSKQQNDLDKKSQLVVNIKNVQVNERLAETGGSTASVFGCVVDGWVCAMKVFIIMFLF
jgi:hypothetical protein